MVKSACCSLVTKVGNEGEEGEGRELSQRRGGKRYSVSSAPFLSGMAALPLLDPTNRHSGMPLDTEFGVPDLLGHNVEWETNKGLLIVDTFSIP